MADNNVRSRYVNDGAAGVSPQRLLVMLYDRLVLDLEQADAAILVRDIGKAHDKLVHAQAIILELHTALDQDAWEGGEGLGQLYLWLNNELMQANVKKDVRGVRICLDIVRDLQGAWRQALEATTGAPAVAAAPAVTAG